MQVVIIGAGLSGLTAAVLLQEAGADVQLIEADTHVGGRIRSLREPATNTTLADLGPTWVWPKYQPIVEKWINKLGLETFEQFNDGDAVLLGFGPRPLRQPLPGQDGMVRIVGGPAALVDALSHRLDRARIRTSSPVSGIHDGGLNGVRVQLVSGETLAADHVIVSTPLRVAASRLVMPWAAPDLLDAMRRAPTWMSTHAKAVALYDRPFWRDTELSGRIASKTGPLVEAHDHSGVNGMPAAIFGFVGWPPHIRQRDPDGLRRAILDQLEESFGPSAANPVNLVVQDWAMNPNIVTDLDLSEPANHPNVGPATLRQAHLDSRVLFSVSEASKISPGLIEGALAAGEHAAEYFVRNR